MNTPIKQEVYLPTDLDNSHYAAITFDRFCEDYLTKKEGFFFTPKQLNELLSNVIKNALDTAAETQKETCICNQESCVCSDKSNYIMQSITNTFEQIFQKYKV